MVRQLKSLSRPFSWLNQSAGPPNLDDLLKQWWGRLSGPSGTRTPSSKTPSTNLWPWWVAGALVLTLLSGFVIVRPAQQGVVTRFGRYVERLAPGPHWLMPVISQATLVNTQRVSVFPYKAEMLTKDENIVFVSLSVQYRVRDPQAFLFNVAQPRASLEQATASALRQVVGETTLDAMLTHGRAQVREAVLQQLTTILKRYHTGLTVMDVNLDPVRPPEAVTAAFDDAVKAREDEQRYINQAEAYAERVLPIAEGQAKRMLREAKAYRAKVVLLGRAEISRFNAWRKAHDAAPKAIEWHLYTGTLGTLLHHSRKVVLDGQGQHINMLPLSNWFHARSGRARPTTQPVDAVHGLADHSGSVDSAVARSLGVAQAGERHGYPFLSQGADN